MGEDDAGDCPLFQVIVIYTFNYIMIHCIKNKKSIPQKLNQKKQVKNGSTIKNNYKVTFKILIEI